MNINKHNRYSRLKSPGVSAPPKTKREKSRSASQKTKITFSNVDPGGLTTESSTKSEIKEDRRKSLQIRNVSRRTLNKEVKEVALQKLGMNAEQPVELELTHSASNGTPRYQGKKPMVQDYFNEAFNTQLAQIEFNSNTDEEAISTIIHDIFENYRKHVMPLLEQRLKDSVLFGKQSYLQHSIPRKEMFESISVIMKYAPATIKQLCVNLGKELAKSLIEEMSKLAPLPDGLASIITNNKLNINQQSALRMAKVKGVKDQRLEAEKGELVKKLELTYPQVNALVFIALEQANHLADVFKNSNILDPMTKATEDELLKSMCRELCSIFAREIAMALIEVTYCAVRRLPTNYAAQKSAIARKLATPIEPSPKTNEVRMTEAPSSDNSHPPVVLEKLRFKLDLPSASSVDTSEIVPLKRKHGIPLGLDSLPNAQADDQSIEAPRGGHGTVHHTDAPLAKSNSTGNIQINRNLSPFDRGLPLNLTLANAQAVDQGIEAPRGSNQEFYRTDVPLASSNSAENIPTNQNLSQSGEQVGPDKSD